MTIVSYAQNFEDVILWRALGHIERGTYVDIGAQDPVTDSVSLSFYERGWRGVHVEPVAQYAEMLRRARPDELTIQAAVGSGGEVLPFFEVVDSGLSTGNDAHARKHAAAGHVVQRIAVPQMPLSAILDRVRDQDVHWLKIDVEGMEEQVIKSWSPSSVRPWIVLVESTEPNSPVATHSAWELELLRLGYAFVYFDGLNRFYVSDKHPELTASFGAGPNGFDDFTLTTASPFVSGIRAQITATANEMASLSQRVAVMDDRRRSTIANEKSLNRRLMTLEQQLGDIHRSVTWHLSAPFRIVEQGLRFFLREIAAWTSLKPGSRVRRLARLAVVNSIRQALKRPKLAASAKRLSARFPPINERLRYMTYNERARRLLLGKASPEDGVLDVDMEPQSVRLTYRRLMRAHSNLDRLTPANLSSADGKPRLAFVSPLPPEKSGIADRSVELLPELALHYAIDVVVAQSEVSDQWIRENCKIRDVKWFERHAHTYDRIIYQFGNSLFHDHMFQLLDRYPGVVVLHDFFLGGVTAHLELYGGVRGFWAKALYEAHGYGALQERYEPDGELRTVHSYPVNFSILTNAQGVIVHSEYSRSLADKYYGEGFGEDWTVVPLPRLTPAEGGRDEARKELGLADDAFLVCAFGILGETKLNQRLLQAWLEGPFGADPNSHLVFVGQDSQNDEYCEQLRASIKESAARKRISITGFASPETYERYLKAADVAVQLRTLSRGEASAAVLDCLAYGVPTIVNANGAMAELPRKSVMMLPDEFSVAELTRAIETLKDDPVLRASLGREGRRLIGEKHSPHHVAELYFAAVEKSARLAPAASDVRALAEHVMTMPEPRESPKWLDLARSLTEVRNVSRHRTKQLLFDVSILARDDFKTGIQRVVRAQLLALLKSPPAGFRVEPIWLADIDEHWHYRYARQYVLRLLDLPDDLLEDDPVEVGPDDIFYMADYWTDGVIAASDQGIYAAWRALGVKTSFMVHDLLPVLRPDCFPVRSEAMHAEWLSRIATNADQLVCISQAVADETSQWLSDHHPELVVRPSLVRLHHGADIASSAPSRGLPDDHARILELISSIPSFLMVGTIEPRKGHLQAVAAFEKLWAEGHDLNLVIVGGEGWKTLPQEDRRNIPAIVERLRNHPDLGKRLFWLDSISDEYLEKVYQSCVCLLAASEGEGFGLPLIEAALHHIPILARDIPVFREVAGDHAAYFVGLKPDDLASAITHWLSLHAEGRAPKSDGMPWITWEQNTENLKMLLVAHFDEASVCADKRVMQAQT